MRVLVCGSRKWSDKQRIQDELRKLPIGTVIIEGGARGADELAAKVAKELGFKVKEYSANWERYGRAAGPIRNKQMLDGGKPDIIYAFHTNIMKSKGTLNMLKQGFKKGIPYKLFNKRREKWRESRRI